MSEFLALVQASGPLGLGVGLAVLVAVYALSYAGVVVSGDQKRLANVVLSILLSGVSILNPMEKEVVVAGIASIGSALVYELVQYLAKKQAAAKA